jgi:hypothetical protein
MLQKSSARKEEAHHLELFLKTAAPAKPFGLGQKK